VVKNKAGSFDFESVMQPKWAALFGTEGPKDDR